jgi:hypothetical protein
VASQRSALRYVASHLMPSQYICGHHHSSLHAGQARIVATSNTPRHVKNVDLTTGLISEHLCMSALLPESVHAMRDNFPSLRLARLEPTALALIALLVLGAVVLEARDWILRKRSLELEQSIAPLRFAGA